MVTVQTAVLTELEPIVEANLNRHLEQAKPWNPHEFVPWTRGRDFALLGGQDWAPEDSSLDEVAKAAMVVNLSHRGQPAVIPPRDRTSLRARRSMGSMGRSVDGRRGAPQHRDPRLSHCHAWRRSGSTGAPSHAAHRRRLRLGR